MKFATVEEAVKDIQRGRFIIMVDDEDRENEGDLVIAAEKITPQRLNWMIKNARGILCVPVDGKRLDELRIPLMVENSNDRFKTPFTVSVDAKKETTTGVSVSDRIATIKRLIDKNAKPEDFAMPGHVFPLRAKENGVLERPGHTEATVDLMKLANLYPAAVIAEIMKDDGEMAKLEELMEFAEKHEIKIITIKDLISHRKKSNSGH